MMVDGGVKMTKDSRYYVINMILNLEKLIEWRAYRRSSENKSKGF